MPIPRNKSTQNFSTIPTLNQNLNSRAPRRNKSSTNLSSNNLIQPLSSNTSKPRTLVSQPSKSSLKKSNHQLNKSNHQLNNQQLNSYESAPPWMKAAMKKRQLDRSAKNILESKSTGEISDVFSDANKAKLAGFYTTNCHQGFAKFILKEKKTVFYYYFMTWQDFSLLQSTKRRRNRSACENRNGHSLG